MGKKLQSREILHQIREEAAKKISDSRCRILICAGTGCLAGGSGEIYRRMSELAEKIRILTWEIWTGDCSW